MSTRRPARTLRGRAELSLWPIRLALSQLPGKLIRCLARELWGVLTKAVLPERSKIYYIIAVRTSIYPPF